MKRHSQARQLGLGWTGEMRWEDVPPPQRERVLKVLRMLLEERAQERTETSDE